MKARQLDNSAEFRMDMKDGSPGIILQVRVLDAEDRHVYSTDVDGLTKEYVIGCLEHLVDGLRLKKGA